MTCSRDPANGASAQQQVQGSEHAHPSSDASSHPLAEAESQSRHEQTPSSASHQPTPGTSQAAGLSEELLDLFESVEHLRQEVEGLQQPQGLAHTSGQQELASEQVLHPPSDSTWLQFIKYGCMASAVHAIMDIGNI